MASSKASADVVFTPAPPHFFARSNETLRLSELIELGYLRIEDVVEFLRHLAAKEETDACSKLNEAAAHIERIGNGNTSPI
jgi:hypothetical protein